MSIRAIEKDTYFYKCQEGMKDGCVMGGIIEIDQERCKGCDLCIVTCNHGRIVKAGVRNGKGCYPAIYKYGDNKSCPPKCMLCWHMCPDIAIKVLKDVEDKK